MKLTLSWLKEHLNTDAGADEISDALTQCGLEVERVHDRGRLLADFSVAHVVEVETHPNADKLQLCRVKTHNDILNIVCGAPNVRRDMNVIVAFPGTYIPGTQHLLKTGSIRGIESQGMICSERELMISDEHDGIIEVEKNIPIGTPAANALGLDDPIFEIAVTPNRPDALGVRGIARDLAAKGIGTLKNLPIPEIQADITADFSIVIEPHQKDDSLPTCPLPPCPFCVGRIIRGVENKPSPKWLQKKLTDIGLRPVSALVDITNYITMTFARPLHTFDADKIVGKKIVFRNARTGESLHALDGKTYHFDPNMTIITDAEKPISIAGIMGGEESGCTFETKNIFLESAYFDPIQVAKTGRTLDIRSDARFRFERGVDPLFVEDGAEIATQMILDICGGQASEMIRAGTAPFEEKPVFLRKNRVASLGGMEVMEERQKDILSCLGFAPKEEGDRFVCTIPSWRPDIYGEEDLVEEICRIEGIEHAPPIPMRRNHAITKPILTIQQKRVISVRRAIAARGMDEAVTWSFLSHHYAILFGGGEDALRLVNPISSELSDMRPSLIPNLLEAAKRNHVRGVESLGLFETGQTYHGITPQEESLRVGGIRCGMDGPRHWRQKNKPIDVFDVKGDVLIALQAAGAPVEKLLQTDECPSWFTPGRSGVFKLGHKTILAYFGEIHPRILKKMDITGPVAAFEVILDAIPIPKRTSTPTRQKFELSNLQQVTRDFAFILDNNIRAHDVIRAIEGVNPHMQTDVTLFDLFAGKDAEEKFGKNKKSVAIEVIFTPKEKTFTDEDIIKLSQSIIEIVEKKFNGILRT